MRQLLTLLLLCHVLCTQGQIQDTLTNARDTISVEVDTRKKVLLETTHGNIMIALYDETPIHRDNFLRLTREGYYDSLLFHRVIAEFMIQAGDPKSRHAEMGEALGEGSTDYTLPAEICLPQLFHKRGAVAAARESDDVNPERRSSGSQFYIVWGRTCSPIQVGRFRYMVERATQKQHTITEDMEQEYVEKGGTPHLDGQYTVFGEVIEGLREVVEPVSWLETDGNDRPLQDVRILRATVIEESTEKK